MFLFVKKIWQQNMKKTKKIQLSLSSKVETLGYQLQRI
jgi:hypothetical protein